jgi:hypothetical protein
MRAPHPKAPWLASACHLEEEDRHVGDRDVRLNGS